MRLRPGEAVVAADGAGRWVLCRYREDGALEPDGPSGHEPPPAARVTVAFSPAKGDRPEWVVQKLTEVGVDRIVVLRTARSVVRWDEERERSAMARLGRVAKEAAAQSRRVRVPEIAGVLGLADLEGEGLVLAEPGGPALDASAAGVVVGPEGGWTDRELASWPTVGLGDGVLRAETAAICAGALLCAQRAGTV